MADQHRWHPGRQRDSARPDRERHARLARASGRKPDWSDHGHAPLTRRQFPRGDRLGGRLRTERRARPQPNISHMFQNGCGGPFAVKSGGDSCEVGSSPYTCVRGITDGRLSTLVDDYNNRWAPSGTCTQNHWPGIQPGDPRLVTVFLTNSLPATQNASDVYPITGFGAFYATGWDGAPSSCGSSGANGQKRRRALGCSRRRRLGSPLQACAALR